MQSSGALAVPFPVPPSKETARARSLGVFPRESASVAICAHAYLKSSDARTHRETCNVVRMKAGEVPPESAEYVRGLFQELLQSMTQVELAKRLGVAQSAVSRARSTGRTRLSTYLAAAKLSSRPIAQLYSAVGMPMTNAEAAEDETADPWERAARSFLGLGDAAEREQRLTFVDWLRESAFAGLPMRTADEVMSVMLSQWGPWRAMERGKRVGVTEPADD